MRPHLIFTPSTILIAAALTTLIGCDDPIPCRADGSCPAGLACDPADLVCRIPCTDDGDCTQDTECTTSLPINVCRLVTDASCVGQLGCVCNPDGTCHLGSKCVANLCQDAMGEENQPCRNLSADAGGVRCSEGLECVVRSEASICRNPAFGHNGTECFARVNVGQGLLCREADAICDLVCKGNEGGQCGRASDCSLGLDCVNSACEAPSSADGGVDEDGGRPDGSMPDSGMPDGGMPDSGLVCSTREACAEGQFCCGEPGTQYADSRWCQSSDGSLAAFAECFDAADEIYAKSCQSHGDCSEVHPRSPDPEGLSLCMPWTTTASQTGMNPSAICSAPCNPGLPKAGCPRDWSCSAAFTQCFSNEECGADTTCEGANPVLLTPGHCRCNAGLEVGATCTVAGTSSTTPFIGACSDLKGSLFCKVGDHCVPPER